jgi:hypothetical protein
MLQSLDNLDGNVLSLIIHYIFVTCINMHVSTESYTLRLLRLAIFKRDCYDVPCRTALLFTNKCISHLIRKMCPVPQRFCFRRGTIQLGSFMEFDHNSNGKCTDLIQFLGTNWIIEEGLSSCELARYFLCQLILIAFAKGWNSFSFSRLKRKYNRHEPADPIENVIDFMEENNMIPCLYFRCSGDRCYILFKPPMCRYTECQRTFWKVCAKLPYDSYSDYIRSSDVSCSDDDDY